MAEGDNPPGVAQRNGTLAMFRVKARPNECLSRRIDLHGLSWCASGNSGREWWAGGMGM